ncbi:unnamed protein product [Darwinula stevensoni]|uniref:DNA helicase n=1 Tax=Darwinula stevensoni TaxID=69355 RepID=A0A7R8XEJ3_9CRUS|nr:unnamed protein product [Darwinula stevensoni]CAG0889659.1 unnamed protein product [Darwinula stevensoni]
MSLQGYIAPVYATPAYKARMGTQNLNYITEDKLEMLVNEPKEFVFKGAAGTGKTWLLQEKIRNIVMSWFYKGPILDKDEKILFVCRNRLLAEHLEETLPNLLLTSVMAALSKWIDRAKAEDEMRRVQLILRKNIIICWLHPIESRLGVRDWKKMIPVEAPAYQEEVKANDALELGNLASRMRYASWEIRMLYELLRHSVATLRPEKKKNWLLKMKVIGHLFHCFTPSPETLKFLSDSNRIMALVDANVYQLIYQESVGKSMLGIHYRLFECLSRVEELPIEVQDAVLREMEAILKAQKPPFHHVFVDECEDLCFDYDGDWFPPLRAFRANSEGYFWRAYDPLSLQRLPDTLKKEVEGARPLFTVFRNPKSVFQMWKGGNETLQRDINFVRSSSNDPGYKREDIRLGCDEQAQICSLDVPSLSMMMKPSEPNECFEYAYWLEGEIEHLIESVVLQRHQLQEWIETVAGEIFEKAVEQSVIQQWLSDAKKFVAETFPYWETETRVIPPLRDVTKSSLVSFLFHFGKEHGESMFIFYSRDIKQVLKTRFSGGMYERLENIQEADHDIVIVDRKRGLLFIKVCYTNERQQGETVNAMPQLLRQKCDNSRREFERLKALMKVVGLESSQVKKCFCFHFPIIAFPEVRKEEKLPHNVLVLYENECHSWVEFQSWWYKHIIRKNNEFNQKESKTMLLKADESNIEKPDTKVPDTKETNSNEPGTKELDTKELQTKDFHDKSPTKEVKATNIIDKESKTKDCMTKESNMKEPKLKQPKAKHSNAMQPKAKVSKAKHPKPKEPKEKEPKEEPKAKEAKATELNDNNVFEAVDHLTFITIFAAPLYATQELENDSTQVHFLTDREFEILVNEPTKCIIKGESEDNEMKLMREKIRNLITKWFSQRGITKQERILIVSPSETTLEEQVHVSKCVVERNLEFCALSFEITNAAPGLDQECSKAEEKHLKVALTSEESRIDETRGVGGGIESLLKGEHDILLLHRNFGVIFIQAKNLDTQHTGKKLRDAVKRNTKTAGEQLKKDLLSLEVAMQESDVFLCEEDLESLESIELWWNERILHHIQYSTIDSNTYLKLLAMYIAPLYATPAYSARLTTQKLNFLTEDKLDLLVNKPKEFIFKGAAGTGKTWLLQEKIRNIVMSWFHNGPLAEKEERIVFVCHNRLLASYLWKTLPDLLLTSAMAELKKWIKKTDEENEKKRVRHILQNNIIICCLNPKETNFGIRGLKEANANDAVIPQEDKAIENEEFEFGNFATRMRYACWEMVIFYEILKRTVALLPTEDGRRWPLKVAIIRRLFQAFTPETGTFKYLDDSIKTMAFKEASPHQPIREESVDKLIRGISRRLSECWTLLMELPLTTCNVVLAEVEKILKTQEPPFHHIFVDEAEDLCLAFHDHWWTSFRSLHKGGEGYFWRAYDPLSMAITPNSLEKEVKGAHSLFTVYRNPASVLGTWTAENLSPERDFELTFSGTRDTSYKREEVRSGHALRGPKVESFRVTSSNLAEKIQDILRDKFGNGIFPGEIAILFAEATDSRLYKERLRNEMRERLQYSSYVNCAVIEYAGDFKGREAPIVFLITNERGKRRDLFYMGASRSTSHFIQLVMRANEEENKAVEKNTLEVARKILPDGIRENFLRQMRLMNFI